MASVAWRAPPGPLVATGGLYDKHLRLWDPAAGRELPPIPVAHRVAAVAFSPDGKTLVWAQGSKVIVWDVANRKVRHTLEGHFSEVLCLAYSAHGNVIASGSKDQTVRLWNAATGNLHARSEAHRVPVTAVVLSPDGCTVISAGTDGIRFAKVADGSETRPPLKPPRGERLSLALAPDGAELAIAAAVQGNNASPPRGRLRLVTLATGEVRWDREYYECGLTAIAFAPDGKGLALASERGGGGHTHVELLDVARGKPRWETATWPSGVEALAFADDGKTLVVGGVDGVLRFRRTQDGALAYPAAEPIGPLWFVALAPDGRTVVSGGGDPGHVTLWSVASGRPLWSRRPVPGDIASVALLASTGDRVLAVAGDRDVFFLDARTGDALPREAPDGGPKVDRGAALSPDGTVLAACCPAMGDLKLWDTATGKMLRLLKLNQFGTRALAWSPDGKRLVAGNPDGSVRVWDPRTGQLLLTLTGHKDAVASVAVSPDGLLLASADLSGQVRLWDLLGGAELWSAKVPTWASGVGFAADARTVLVLEGHDTVHVLDGHRGAPCGTLPLRHVQALALSRDAALLATAHEDGSVVLWKTTALGKPLAVAATKLILAEAGGYWQALAGDDARLAHEARWQLAGSPAVALPLLLERLKAIPAVSAERLRQLLSDLGSDKFKLRETATAELARLGQAAVPALQQALADKPGLETRLRIEQLLKRIDEAQPTPAELRALRAVAVLELIGTDEARRQLETLAGGEPAVRLTALARAALARLDERRGK